MNIGGESNIDFRTQCIIMKQIKWPPTPYYKHNFRIFHKIDSFLKNISHGFDSKKSRLHLWRTASFTYKCWYTFFLFCCGFQEKLEPCLLNYLIWTANWDGEHNNFNTQNTLIIFLSAIAVMQVIFWVEDNFCFISDCRNSFNCKLKKLINEQIIVFYSPSNPLCSSDEICTDKTS